jgi:exonuclease SbcC
MFESLETKNFRRLRDNTFEFTHGLNAIRGLNEHGKSTVFEALGYALFGTEALRESLDDVVTWGEKTASLSVKLAWQVNKMSIVIRRSKAGAELDVDGKLEVTGQREVTRFCESLVADAKLATKLMMASQAGLRGALSEGPTAAAQLIEQLANFGLIDEIITLVTENLPSGNPSGLEAQMKQLDLQVAAGVPAAPDLGSLKTRQANAMGTVERLGKELASVRADLVPAAAAAEAMRAAVAEHKAKDNALSAAVTQLASLKVSAEQLKPESSVSAERLAELRKLVADEKDEVQARQAWAELKALPKSEDEWEGNRASFDTEVEAQRSRTTELALKVAEVQQAEAVVRGMRINEATCGLCGKDLKGVPEVAEKNAKFDKQLADFAEQLKLLCGEQIERREVLSALQRITKIDSTVRTAYQRWAKYIEVLDTHVPARFKWTGPAFKPRSEDHTSELQQAEAEVKRAADHSSRLSALNEQISQSQNLCAKLKKTVAELAKKAENSKQVLNLETDLTAAVRQVENDLVRVQADQKVIESEIRSAVDAHTSAVKAHAALVTARETVQQQLEELALNNVLIKKLRAARPKVADKLWGTVLSAVAHYFSQIRGVQSTITKDGDGFKIDGKSVKGFSGSTLDALGLALRIALTKTFMPNNDFLILDEPGAACDDEREANMLGLVAACGFSQVLLVTHSQLADVFADSMLVL